MFEISRRGRGGVDEWSGPLWPPVGEGCGQNVEASMQGDGGRPQGPPPRGPAAPAPTREREHRAQVDAYWVSLVLALARG